MKEKEQICIMWIAISLIGILTTTNFIFLLFLINDNFDKTEFIITKEIEKICVDKYKEEGNATWCIMSDNIDIRWLNENCLVYWCDLEDNCDYFEGIADGGWGKYKCGDFLVKVIK